VSIDAGTLQIGDGGTAGGLAAATPVNVATGAALVFDRSGALTYGGTISGAGGLTKQGGGTVTLSAANLYTGPTTIAGGTLRAGNATAFGTGEVAVNAGGLDLNGNAVVIGVLSGSSGASIFSNAGAASLKSEFTGVSTFAGVISNGAGTVGFEKAGNGTLTFTQDQLYTGNTIISGGGVLVLANGVDLASASIKVGTELYDTSKLDVTALAGGLVVANAQKLGGYGTVEGNVTIANGAILAPGGSIGSMTNTGDMTWGGGGRFLFEIYDAAGAPATDWDALLISGGLTITSSSANPFVIDMQTLANPAANSPGLMPTWDGDTNHQWLFVVAGSEITSFDASGFTFNTTNFLNAKPGTFSVARGDSGGTNNALYIVYAAVPEPGTLVLAGIGLAAAGWHLRRRRM
jgi:fibronectin-binding autotransporter adhesin